MRSCGRRCWSQPRQQARPQLRPQLRREWKDSRNTGADCHADLPVLASLPPCSVVPWEVHLPARESGHDALRHVVRLSRSRPQPPCARAGSRPRSPGAPSWASGRGRALGEQARRPCEHASLPESRWQMERETSVRGRQLPLALLGLSPHESMWFGPGCFGALKGIQGWLPVAQAFRMTTSLPQSRKTFQITTVWHPNREHPWTKLTSNLRHTAAPPSMLWGVISDCGKNQRLNIEGGAAVQDHRPIGESTCF